MIAHLNIESSPTPSMLKIAVNAFKDGVKDFSNQLLIELIFIIKTQNNSINDYLAQLEAEPYLLETLDYDEIDIFMNKSAYKIKKLLTIIEPFKTKPLWTASP